MLYNALTWKKSEVSASFPGSGSVCTSGGGPGLQNQLHDSASPSQSSTSGNAEENLAFCLAFLAQKSPDLALIVERWDSLPEPVRAGIVAMIKVAGGK